jgi:hypothetical protein
MINNYNFQQMGLMNIQNITNSGNENDFIINQFGNCNKVDQLVESNSAYYEVNQSGNFNSLFHFDNTNDGIGIIINQTGESINTIIINGYIR